MPNLHDLLRQRAARPGEQFELDLGDEHLEKLPPELQPFAKEFKFTRVPGDPFAPPEEPKPKATK